MQILVASPFFPSVSWPYAGVFVAQQARAVAKMDADVCVASFAPLAPWPLTLVSERWRRFSQVPSTYTWSGVPVEVRRYLAIPRNGNLHSVARQLRSHLARILGAGRRPDVLHAHFAFPMGWAAVEAARTTRVPVCLTVHGSDLNRVPLLGPRHRSAVVSALARANCVLAVSDALRRRALELCPTAAVRVAYIGVDLTAFSPGCRDEARARVTSLRGVRGRIVLYVGNILASKGVTVLLDAFSRLADTTTHLVLVGGGSLVGQLERRAVAVGAHDRVHLLGSQPHVVIPDLMRAADVFVLPSYSEGLPTVCAEALACGIPVVATSVGGVPEIVRNGETGLLVKPGEAGELARTLSEVLNDPALRRRLARAGRAHVEQHFDLRLNSAALLDLYREAAACV